MFFTGFEPWDTVTFNPSWDAAQGAAEELATGCARLSVDFETARKVLDVPPPETSLLVMFGVAVRRDQICLERYAHNTDPNDEKLQKRGPVARETNLDLRPLTTEKIGDFDVVISRDPGDFVCNATYFHALKTTRYESVFVHIPMMDSETARMVGTQIARRFKNVQIR